MSPEAKAQLARHEEQSAEHYKIAAQINQAKHEREILQSELAHITHDYELADHALKWLQQRDGLSAHEFSPDSIEDKSWVEACGVHLLLLSPVMIVPGSKQKALTKPMKPHHIALFPDLYKHKPKLKVLIRGAERLRSDSRRPMERPRAYCVVEIPGKPHSKFKTKAVESMSPNWEHEQMVPAWEPGNSLHFSIFREGSMMQKGTAVRIVGMTSGKKELNGVLGRCAEWDASRGSWMVAFEDGRQVPVKQENLEIADGTGAADEFLGWCQIASRKYTPDGFDGVLDLHQSGSSGALLRVHIDPQAIGEILQHSEYVTDGQEHHAPRPASHHSLDHRSESHHSRDRDQYAPPTNFGRQPLDHRSISEQTRDNYPVPGSGNRLGSGALASTTLGSGHLGENYYEDAADHQSPIGSRRRH